MQLRATRLTAISHAVRRVVAPAAFSPATLFAAGEQGIWLDPSDMSTMFQDAAGTVPVTAVEQPVGLILDKSRGLVLGPELLANGDFSNGSTGWTLSSGVSIQNQQAVFTNTLNRNDGLLATGLLSAGKRYQVTFTLVSIASGTLYVFMAGNSSRTFNAPGTYTININAGTTTSNFGIVNSISENSVNCVIDNISVREIAGNHATQATATSRPILRQDAGGRYYLFFDGIDDSLVTGTITPGTDKVQVFAGVRKLSDAAAGILLELSATVASNAGSFYLSAPNSATQEFGFLSGGSRRQADTTAIIDNAAFASPVSAVISATGDIPASQAVIRANGTIYATATGSQGTGNYLAYPLYIGRRNQATLPFSGHLYQLVSRFGPNLPIETIQQAETFFNQKTGAY